MPCSGEELGNLTLQRAVHAGCGLVLAVLLAMVIRSGAAAAVLKAAFHVGPITLVLALALTIASMVAYGAIWAWVLRCMGCRATANVGLTVFAGSGLASYAGSGAGAIAESVVLLRKHGICAGRATLLLALASLIGFCGAVVWAGS